MATGGEKQPTFRTVRAQRTVCHHKGKGTTEGTRVKGRGDRGAEGRGKVGAERRGGGSSRGKGAPEEGGRGMQR